MPSLDKTGHLLDAICNRAMKLLPRASRDRVRFSLIGAEIHGLVDINALSAADDHDFVHDIMGIATYDPSTQQLKDHFVCRCAPSFLPSDSQTVVIRNNISAAPEDGSYGDLSLFIPSGHAVSDNDARSPTGVCWMQPGLYDGFPAALIYHFDADQEQAEDLPWDDRDCMVAIEIGSCVANGQRITDSSAVRAAAVAHLRIAGDQAAFAAASHDCEDTSAWDVLRSLAAGRHPVSLVTSVSIKAYGVSQTLVWGAV